MQQKQAACFIIGVFLVLGVMFVLSAVAIPHAGRMAYASKAEVKTTELITIQAAVAEMLRESPAGKLNPIGPVTDMNRVRTVDAMPLFLSDFLTLGKDDCLNSGYVYSFTADGTVIQYAE